MDEEFGKEVNFRLQRQYRSAPAIQAWPARAFYGQRAAEPDKSVENIKLEDLLVTDAQMITNRLVLVDLNRLEGEWRKTMFEVVILSKEIRNILLYFSQKWVVLLFTTLENCCWLPSICANCLRICNKKKTQKLHISLNTTHNEFKYKDIFVSYLKVK